MWVVGRVCGCEEMDRGGGGETSGPEAAGRECGHCGGTKEQRSGWYIRTSTVG